MPAFAIVAHDARTDGDWSLDSLSGGGRIDLICRCLSSSLLISHGIRKDSNISVLFYGPPGPAKTLFIKGDEIKRLYPDERSIASIIRIALLLPCGREFRKSAPGVYIRKSGLTELLSSNEFALLIENGEDLRKSPITYEHFLLSDHRNFTDEEFVQISELPKYSIGPESLHADQVITLVHNEFDRRESGWRS